MATKYDELHVACRDCEMIHTLDVPEVPTECPECGDDNIREVSPEELDEIRTSAWRRGDGTTEPLSLIHI